MTGLEITLFILGTAFIIISFFIVDNSENKPKASAARALDADAFEQLRTDFTERTAKEADIILHEAEDKLESLSNDKIIAVGEYSDQVLEKIEANHKEVVFLYQMLNDKEEELKSAVTKMDNVRIECEKMLKEEAELRSREEQRKAQEKAENERLAAEISAQVNNPRSESKAESDLRTSDDGAVPKSSDAARKTASGSGMTHVIPGTIRKNSAAHATRKPVSGNISKTTTDTMPEKLDTGSLSRNDEIIALHKKGKSVMEISKLLGMGQGEVKLIIELYC